LAITEKFEKASVKTYIDEGVEIGRQIVYNKEIGKMSINFWYDVQLI